MKFIVEPEWLLKQMHNSDVVVADCRFILGQPNLGRNEYELEHLPGAVYFDLDKHLSSLVREHGGRHPLPDLQAFASLLGASGISNQTIVVAYDDQGGAMASRLWWLLRYAGHDQVYILNGGFSAWKAAGHPVTAEVSTPDPTVFEVHLRGHMTLQMEEVKARLGRSDVTLIDSREEPRYLGITEPIDTKAGHIPGAVNHFWKGALDEQGRWRDTSGQLARFHELPLSQEVVVYCGSGVTACPNVLALEEAGFENVKLYAGSWSDWISYSENLIATGNE